jgi:hypothetical protein
MNNCCFSYLVPVDIVISIPVISYIMFAAVCVLSPLYLYGLYRS